VRAPLKAVSKSGLLRANENERLVSAFSVGTNSTVVAEVPARPADCTGH